MGRNMKTRKRSAFKGAVLFTVLAVMMVVIIIMLTTIALAGVASRRAYSEYADAQVVSSAQSVVDTVLESLKPGSNSNEDLGDTIYADILKKSQTNDKTPFVVKIEDGGELGNGMGRVDRLEFSYAGKDSMSGYYIKGSDIIIMKVTSYVQMGDEETSYTQYLTDLVSTPPGSGGGTGGLLSAGATNLSGTSISVLGPFGGGLNEDSRNSSSSLTLKNEGVFYGNQSFNHSLDFNVTKLMVYGTNKPAAGYSDAQIGSSDYQGISVLGNMTFSSSGIAFISKKEQTNDKAVPYVFVTGTINYGSCSVSIGTLEKGKIKKGSQYAYASGLTSEAIGNKVNVYCGEFKCPTEPKELAAVGDLYCYNENGTSFLRGQNSRSRLIQWAEYVTTSRESWDDSTKNEVDGSLNMWKGNINTKGSLKLGASDFTIDGNVYVEKDLDLSDLNNSAAGIPDITGTLKVKGNVIKPATETADANRKAKYDALVAKVEQVTTSQFPADKELGKVLGVDFSSAAVTGSEQLKAVEDGDYTIDATTDVSGKIIQNAKEQQSKYYDFTPTKQLKGSTSSSGVVTAPTAPAVYTPATVPTTVIHDQCILTLDNANDHYQNKTIKIDPNIAGQSNSGKVLWVELDGSMCTDGSKFFDGGNLIIVEDREKDASGNFVFEKDVNGNDTTIYKRLTVNFYIKEGSKIVLSNKDRIMTQYYYDTYYNNTTNPVTLQNDLVVNTAALDVNLRPHLYIYSSNNEDGLGHENSSFQMTNNGLVTAYIVAPTTKFTVSDGGDKAAAIVKYDGVEYKNLKIGIIGSAIVGSVGEAAGNDFVLVYIPNDGGSLPATPQIDHFAFSLIPGYSDY